jgi:hypothetical protein
MILLLAVETEGSQTGVIAIQDTAVHSCAVNAREASFEELPVAFIALVQLQSLRRESTISPGGQHRKRENDKGYDGDSSRAERGDAYRVRQVRRDRGRCETHCGNGGA